MPHLTRSPLVVSPRVAGTIATVVLGLLSIAAVVVWWRTGSSWSLYVVGTFWAVAGIIASIFRFIEHVPDAVARLLTGVGLTRGGEGFSDIEAMVAQGHYEAAAESYRMRATGAQRVWATVARARLLMEPLGRPEQAADELEALQREGPRLTMNQDIAIGLLLADLLASRGRADQARVELRRLLTSYPSAAQAPLVQSRYSHLVAPPEPPSA